jgi:hypothetical protein
VSDDEWLNSLRWSYTNRVRLAAMQQGYVLLRATGNDPDAQPRDYEAPEWTCEPDEPCLYKLLDEESGTEWFTHGVTLGEIEDFLTTEQTSQREPSTEA